MTTVKWSDKAQERLTSLKAARDQAKAREGELVRERKEIKGRLLELGAMSTRGLEKKLTDAGIPKKTIETLMARNEFVISVFELEYFRDRFKSLGDQIDSTIEGANQGRLFDDDDEPIAAHEPEETELFVKRAKPESDEDETEDEDPHQQQLPVGDTPKVRPEEQEAEGTNAAYRASTKDLGDYGLNARVIRCLEDAGFDKVGKVLTFEVGDQDYTSIAGIGEAAAKAIRDACRQWQKQHSKAEIAADKKT